MCMFCDSIIFYYNFDEFILANKINPYFSVHGVAHQSYARSFLVNQKYWSW